MEELKSISQACFVSLPRKTKPNKPVRSTEQEIGRRYTIFQDTWAYLEGEVLRCQAEAHTDVLNNVMSFVQSRNPALTEASQRLDIPVAALMMGVNMSDHTAVFNLLAAKLHSSVTRMVARLRAKDCNSIAAMIQKVVMDIMQVFDGAETFIRKSSQAQVTFPYLHVNVVHHLLGQYGQILIDNAWYGCEAGGLAARSVVCSVSDVDELQSEDAIFDGEECGELREVYMTFLQAPVCETEDFSKLVKLIRVMSIDELQKRIVDALLVFESNKDFSQAPTSISKLKTCLAEYSEKFTALTDDVPEAPDPNEVSEPVVLDWGKLRSRSQFQEKLKSLAKTKRVSPFEALRDEFANFFAESFSSLKPPSSMPLHEVLYYNDAVALKQYFTPSPRTVLHAALARPQTVLRCECCKNTGTSDVSASLPDLSISYKLHLESGKLINLYDMMQLVFL
ncbi:hypothetical protein HPB50_018857 [Hyalomma asiaticum]|uniref:Uncharacterized protein n=1 Tax=Hyalomma asiaticum TaxID=266040 RepID=A0ACB7S455_HYAAI|nr:hypothetical protein HPB50_018857 [Hyalomma asiaticum]